MVGLGDGTRLLLITFACIAQARPGVEKRWAEPPYKGGGAPSYKAGGGEEIGGGFKFTDDTIVPGFGKDADLEKYQKTSGEIDIPHVDLEEHRASMEFGKGKIGTGFHDIGPMDVVEGAKKFTEEAVKEQEIKGNSNQAYKEQLALSPNDVHVDSTYPAAPSAAPPAAPPATPPPAPPAAPAQPPPPDAAPGW